MLKANKKIEKKDKIDSAIGSSKYISFTLSNEKTIARPVKISKNELLAFCYVKNKEKKFIIDKIKNLQIKDSYFTLKVAGPTIGIDQITTTVNTAINYHKFIRMKYTRASWTTMIVGKETGELIIDRIEAEKSTRTINDIQLSIKTLDQEHIKKYNLNANHITAYCNKREEQRTFRFDRISEIEILDI